METTTNCAIIVEKCATDKAYRKGYEDAVIVLPARSIDLEYVQQTRHFEEEAMPFLQELAGFENEVKGYVLRVPEGFEGEAERGELVEVETVLDNVVNAYLQGMADRVRGKDAGKVRVV